MGCGVIEDALLLVAGLGLLLTVFVLGAPWAARYDERQARREDPRYFRGGPR